MRETSDGRTAGRLLARAIIASEIGAGRIVEILRFAVARKKRAEGEKSEM